MLETLSQISPETKTSKSNSTHSDQNLLIVISNQDSDLKELETRIDSNGISTQNKVIRINQPEDLKNTIIQELDKNSKDENGFQLKRLGILSLRKSGDMADLVAKQLKSILDEPAKKIQEVFLAAKDRIKSEVLRARFPDSISELKSTLKKFQWDSETFNDIAAYLSTDEFKYSGEMKTAETERQNDELNFHPGQIPRLIYKPKEAQNQASDFFPFVDKIFGLQAS